MISRNISFFFKPQTFSFDHLTTVFYAGKEYFILPYHTIIGVNFISYLFTVIGYPINYSC